MARKATTARIPAAAALRAADQSSINLRIVLQKILLSKILMTIPTAIMRITMISQYQYQYFPNKYFFIPPLYHGHTYYVNSSPAYVSGVFKGIKGVG